jgi:chromatin modification-related protein YNG2
VKYIRRSRRTSPASVTPPSPSSRVLSPKFLPIPARISASYAEIHDLAGEKCMLAEQLIQIINRTRSKLDVDIVKVRTLQGEPPEVIAASITRPLPSVLPTLGAEAFGAPGRNPALAISESLRNALAPAVESRVVSAAASPSPSPSGSMAHVNKSEFQQPRNLLFLILTLFFLSLRATCDGGCFDQDITSCISEA